jgi:ABC-2 type transport system permease protein
MINLLKSELIKLKKSPMVLIVWGLFIILPVYQMFDALQVARNGALRQEIETVIDGATSFLELDKNGFFMVIVLMVFVCFLICDEFQNSTIRNALALGINRTKYYAVKLIISTLVMLVGILLMTVAGFICYNSAFGYGEGNYIKSFAVLILLVWSGVSACVMICFLAQKTGNSLVICFIYILSTGFGPALFPKTGFFIFVIRCFTNGSLFAGNFADVGWQAIFPSMIIASIGTVIVTSIIGIIFCQPVGQVFRLTFRLYTTFLRLR